MYYEVYGDGKPTVVLHGGICTIEACLGPILPVLASGRRLIAVEQQAHGHTADIDRPLTFEQMADDTAAVLRILHVEKADIFGFSDGGNVALRLAMVHPTLVDRLALFGTNANNEGFVPGLVDMFATVKAEDMPKEFREAYEKAAPDPKGFATLVGKVMQQALAFKGWTREELQSIRSPALVMVGDRDIIRPEHALEMFRQIPNAQLAVLPGRDHLAPMTAPGEVGGIVNRFLNDPLPPSGGTGGH
jgi:pimeloyl-ACP methyl ester carboxylesterase